MSAEWGKRHQETPEARRLFERERLIVWATDAIYEEMEARGMSKADIANALDKSRAYVTQVLNGSRNMSLATLSDLAWAVGCRASVTFESLRVDEYMTSPALLVPGVRRNVVVARVTNPTSRGFVVPVEGELAS